MYVRTHIVRLFCTAFSKAVALRVAEPRGLSASSVSFVSFSLRLFRQRKAANEFRYQKSDSQNSVNTGASSLIIEAMPIITLVGTAKMRTIRHIKNSIICVIFITLYLLFAIFSAIFIILANRLLSADLVIGGS